ncbi:hypothetical protein [Cupriavidus campinensis]|uniref:Type II toxin-antitoxin system HicB family antitoxin n=1 Tax=Cupriavidus campinensis TaxID=151783 RepID=A0ABY3EK37_9BURK|nr:hypothetical protein [Cupriavidus campinensis]TSP11018.1 hypothetical protein FGG12_19340 [Cupriavidus campinensis]
MGKAEIFLLQTFPDMGREVWAKWDEEAGIYELFLSQEADDYVGCADSVADARKVARDLAKEWMN